MLARILALLAALAGALTLLGRGDPSKSVRGPVGAAPGRSVEAGSEAVLESGADARGPGAQDPGERRDAASLDAAESHATADGLAHPHEITREERNGRIVVRVLDATTGRPLPDAYVLVRGTRRGGLSIGPDAKIVDGRLRVTGWPARARNHLGRSSDGLGHLFSATHLLPLVVEAHHPGHASARWTTPGVVDLADIDVGSMGEPPFHAKEFVVRLEPCAEHEFLLLDGTSGRPVCDRAVSLHVRDPDELDELGEVVPWISRRPDRMCRTDDDGRLHLCGVPPGEYLLRVPNNSLRQAFHQRNGTEEWVEEYMGYEPYRLRVPLRGGWTIVLTRDPPFPEVRSSPHPWTPLGPPGTFPEADENAEGPGVRFP